MRHLLPPFDRLGRFAAIGCSLWLTGCPEPIVEEEAIEPVGTLTGAFTCQVVADDDDRFDLGAARFEGDIEHTAYIAGLRTQGCYARTLEAERGWVVSVRSFQQVDFDTAQVLELNLPINVEQDGDDRLLRAGDLVTMSGDGGFGSMFWVDGAGQEPAPLFLRTLGGEVVIDEPAELGPGDRFSGHFDNLQMGEL